MLLLNPLYWEQINMGDRYVINPERLPGLTLKRKEQLEGRTRCVLGLSSINYGDSALKDKIILQCRTLIGECFNHPSLEIYRSELPPYAEPRSNGSLLVKMSSHICHSCGHRSDRCWELWSKHYICFMCVKLNRYHPPFKYGRGIDRCCQIHGCGTEGEVEVKNDLLYLKAVALVEKYSR